MAIINGNNSNNYLYSRTPGADSIYGFGGDDVIRVTVSSRYLSSDLGDLLDGGGWR